MRGWNNSLVVFIPGGLPDFNVFKKPVVILIITRRKLYPDGFLKRIFHLHFNIGMITKMPGRNYQIFQRTAQTDKKFMILRVGNRKDAFVIRENSDAVLFQLKLPGL